MIWCYGVNPCYGASLCYGVSPLHGVILCYGRSLCYDVCCAMVLDRVIVLACVSTCNTLGHGSHDRRVQ